MTDKTKPVSASNPPESRGNKAQQNEAPKTTVTKAPEKSTKKSK